MTIANRPIRATCADPSLIEHIDRVANAVHEAASWLPPWPPPGHLVVAAGFELVDDANPRGRRRVGTEWDPDPRVRGLRTLLAFARVLIREVLSEPAPPDHVVVTLARRLLIPTPMLAAARRDPSAPGRHVPLAFVLERLDEVPPSVSGAFAQVASRR